jgi:hypothetical protein
MAAYRGWVSEHAYANAIDVESFILASGRRVSVLGGFERGEPTHTRAGSFLRAVSRRAYDEAIFSNVLTPFFDELAPQPLPPGPGALQERRDEAAGVT